MGFDVVLARNIEEGLQGGLKGVNRLLAVPTPSRSLFLLVNYSWYRNLNYSLLRSHLQIIVFLLELSCLSLINSRKNDTFFSCRIENLLGGKSLKVITML